MAFQNNGFQCVNQREYSNPAAFDYNNPRKTLSKIPTFLEKWLVIKATISMTSVATNFTFVVFFIKIAISKTGFTDEILMDKKFHCIGHATEVFTVKSEIQCAHLCLRRRCNLLNYNTVGRKENCEVIADGRLCSTAIDQKHWKAMVFKVRFYKNKLFSNVISLFRRKFL